ncbi:unnamed protein product, partial [Medioppia subpectinata]
MNYKKSLQDCGLIQCPNGTTCCCRNPCPATCDDPFPNCCDTKCVLNCVTSTTMCKNGWVLDKYNGRCMPLECCPVLRNIHLARCQAPLNGQCLGGPMDSNVTCGTLTPDVCGCPTLSDTPKGCLQSACQCAPGYWRRLSDCQCVEKPDCEHTGEY